MAHNRNQRQETKETRENNVRIEKYQQPHGHPYLPFLFYLEHQGKLPSHEELEKKLGSHPSEADILDVYKQVLSPEDLADLEDSVYLSNSSGNCYGLVKEEAVNALTKENFGKFPIDNKKRFRKAIKYQQQYYQNVEKSIKESNKEKFSNLDFNQPMEGDDLKRFKREIEELRQPIEDRIIHDLKESEHHSLETETGKKLIVKTSQYKRPSFFSNLLHAGALGNPTAFEKIKKQLSDCANNNMGSDVCAVINILTYEYKPNWYDSETRQASHSTLFFRKQRKSNPTQSKCLYMEPNGFRVRGDCDEVLKRALGDIKHRYIDDQHLQMLAVRQSTYTP